MQIQLKEGKPTWKKEWKIVGGMKIYFRSHWEYLYALYLEHLKERALIKKWEHEPETFWFENIRRGTRSYLPDFRVTMNDDKIEYCEVKGFMDTKSKTKIKRMGIYYPKIKLRIVDKEWFMKNMKDLKGLASKYE